MRTVLGILLVSVLSLVAIGRQTEGFTILTAESARRADIARHPRMLPFANLQGSRGTVSPFHAHLAADGRMTVVNFMYTRCPSICVTMGTEFQQLQLAIRRHGLEGRVRMLSISFDPADSPQDLARYAKAMKADASVWGLATIPGGAERAALLDAFGIVVVKAPMGQFEHNAAYHIVSPDGRLLRITDVGDVTALLDYANIPGKTLGSEAATRAAATGSSAGDGR